MTTEKTRIAVFVSGGGTNLQALIDAQSAGKIPDGEIVLVVSSNPEAYALTRAARAQIPTVTISKHECGSQGAFEAHIIKNLVETHVELIVLAGFMSILSESFTSVFPRRIINVHPSLIPSFCGKGFYGLRVHQAALDYGVKVTGATVLPDDTPETLQRRVMEEAEWQLLPRAVQMISAEIRKEKDNQTT